MSFYSNFFLAARRAVAKIRTVTRSSLVDHDNNKDNKLFVNLMIKHTVQIKNKKP